MYLLKKNYFLAILDCVNLKVWVQKACKYSQIHANTQAIYAKRQKKIKKIYKNFHCKFLGKITSLQIVFFNFKFLLQFDPVYCVGR